MRPEEWKPPLPVAAGCTLGGLGLLLCLNKALGARYVREPAYWQLLALPWLFWGLLWVLAAVLPGRRPFKR